ncbi:MAG: hypothetical protein IPG89_18190 [Bacteroidetes bacterium]|nr:hypothetical protein [Bacteroidota bacterium]
MAEIKLLKKVQVNGLYIFCTKCKSKINDKCGLTGKNIKTCKWIEKHKYKAIICVPGSATSSVRTKLLETRDSTEATIQTFAFKAELERNDYIRIDVPISTVPNTILEAMTCYISYLNNDTPLEHEHKIRSKGHVLYLEKVFSLFVDYLKTRTVDASIFPIEKLDKFIVGKLKSFLLEQKGYAPKTYNNFIAAMRGFVNYIKNEFDLRLKNPFLGFKKMHVEVKINTITQNEFHDLLKIVRPDNGVTNYQERKTKRVYKKFRYRPWLKDAFLLGLLTGRRREEIVRMKFSGIIVNQNDEPVSISIPDFKVNRGKGLSENESQKMIYVPIIPPLKKLLMKLGYEEHKGKDMYILAPEEEMERRTMMDYISKGFSHYYSLLNTGKDIKFYDLRKTYISYLYAAHGERARIITKHSGEAVMHAHYIDQQVVAQVAMDFEIFGL